MKRNILTGLLLAVSFGAISSVQAMQLPNDGNQENVEVEKEIDKVDQQVQELSNGSGQAEDGSDVDEEVTLANLAARLLELEMAFAASQKANDAPRAGGSMVENKWVECAKRLLSWRPSRPSMPVFSRPSMPSRKQLATATVPVLLAALTRVAQCQDALAQLGFPSDCPANGYLF